MEYDKLRGMIFGHALGDAVGLTTKYKSKREISDSKVKFPYGESIRKFPVCDWTDRTDHLVLVAQSLIENDLNLNPVDIAARLSNWTVTGFKELGDITGVGLSGTIQMIINHPKFASTPSAAASEIWTNSGKRFAHNGSLTRTSVVGALSGDKVVPASQVLSCITHVDSRCVISCMMQSFIINGIIYGDISSPDDIDALLKQAVSVVQNEPQLDGCHEELASWTQIGFTKSIADLQLGDMSKMTYVFKCLGCSMYAMQVLKAALRAKKTPSFRKFITKVAGECGDADANCAVAGAVMGSYLGYSGLPADWISALPHRVWLDDIVARLADLISRQLADHHDKEVSQLENSLSIPPVNSDTTDHEISQSTLEQDDLQVDLHQL